MIRKGTIKLFSDLGIKTTDDASKAEVILYPGGCPTMWPVVMKEISETLEKLDKTELIIGPATFQFGYTDWAGLFTRFAPRIAGLFARDKKSFANIQATRLGNNIKTGLSHDPSLYLRNSQWLEEQKKAAKNEYVLTALRRDHEMKAGVGEKMFKPFESILPEKIFNKIIRWSRKRSKRQKIRTAKKLSGSNLPVKDVDVWNLDFDGYLETICHAKEIHTDRLHVMVFGAMLGKPVFAYETSYGKLEGVYEQSLKSWANVIFVSHH